jgi:hypothetical protein
MKKKIFGKKSMPVITTLAIVVVGTILLKVIADSTSKVAY